MSESKKIKIRSSDGEIFDVEGKVATKSETIKNLLESLESGGDENQAEAIPLPNVTGSVLKKVLEWCTHHKDDEPPVEEKDKDEEKKPDGALEQWDADYIKVDHGALFDLLMASNYMQIKGLLDVACKAVANQLRGKSPEEIRQIFNIKTDFTPEEDEQIKKENAWCED